MDKSLLDTDILSEVMRARNLRIVQQVAEYKAAFGVLTISAITVMEVVKGLRKAIHHQLVLITGNTEHYLRIQRAGFPLKLDNWR